MRHCLTGGRVRRRVRHSADRDILKLLAGLGVTRTEQQRRVASDLGNWVRNLCDAGEYSTALEDSA
jgi:hypothetical protein